MRFRKQGFTLAELLIVVAVIGVLTAIAIPVFSALREKGRESTDAANIRSQYAHILSTASTVGGDVNTDGANKITLKQGEDGWQNETIRDSLAELAAIDGAPAQGGSAWVSFEYSTETVTIHYDGGSGGSGGGESGGSGGGSGTMVAPGTEVALSGGSFTGVSAGAHTLRINSPVATTIYIDVVVHAGGGNSGAHSAEKQRIPITLEPGEHDYGITLDKKGSLGIAFESEISQSDADALVGSIQMIS